MYTLVYNSRVFKVAFTEIFEKWVSKLRDRRARSIIQHTIDMMVEGNLTNTRNVGDGIWEKKINHGPGYRLYYFRNKGDWIILICGGDKSTQQADIEKAKVIKKEWQ